VTKFSIDEFWVQILPELKRKIRNDLPGWHDSVEALPTYVEAELKYAEDYGTEITPSESEVILVSAPGAVGKSTLARQIAMRTGAIYLDLAESDPVGGNTLSGGLVKTGVLSDWEAGSAALLVDGLDEARLKVTQEGFEAFLDDVVYLAQGRKVPTILLGRSGAILDAWLVLNDKLKVSVLEIQHFNQELARSFSEARLKGNPKLKEQHIGVSLEALHELLTRIRVNTKNDGDRFAGYAPVLSALADHVADEPNPRTIISKIEQGEQTITLKTILMAILEREQQKLERLPLEDKKLVSVLYKEAEQMKHLLSVVYNQAPPRIPDMSPRDAETYTNALKTWVPDHPFLGGNSHAVSSVFEAAIIANALKDKNVSEEAVIRELAKGASANPFIAEFYFDDASSPSVSPEHIGVIYSSLRARLALGDYANLSVEAVESSDEDEQLLAEVEIAIDRSGENEPKIFNFKSDQIGTIKLGSHLEDVDLNVPYSKVEIGGASEIILATPISIQCQKIVFDGTRIIVEKGGEQVEGVVFCEAETAETSHVASAPLLNPGTRLIVSWEGAEKYPWNSFQGSPSHRVDPKVNEALRRLRKFVIAFRSHSKGSLKRVAAKLNHERMTKGSGQSVLNEMRNTGIITQDGPMYTLHPDKLFAEAGASYFSVMCQEYSPKTIEFVARAVNT
jgi:hypothetical protein